MLFKIAVVAALVAVSAVLAADHHTIRLNKAVRDSGARSNFMSRYGEAMNRRMGTTPKHSGTNLPIEGSVWPTSIFWTTVQVGTPLRSFAVAIDSGSPDLYLSGVGCKGCVTTFPNVPYDPSRSSTSEEVKFGGVVQNFTATYYTCNPTDALEPCTISGPYYKDMVSLAGYGPAPILLGQIQKQTLDFYQFHTIDGIMGMMTDVNPDKGNVFQSVCIRGGFCKPIWGICMKEGLLSNGTMTIGGVDERLSDGPIQYVNSPNSTSLWHQVMVHNISFGGTMVKADQHSILDTGTNDILLPTQLFKEAHKTICGSNANLAHCHDYFTNASQCFSLTEAEVDAYPGLAFQLDNNVTLTMSSRDYLLKGSPAAASAGQYCFGISNGGNFFIFGDTLMQNYYLVFGEQKVGWGKVNKDNCGSV